MSTFAKKLSIALLAAMTVVMAVAAAPVSAAGLYDANKYYADGYFDENYDFHRYDYDYYHKDGVRSQSFYGDIKSYDAAMEPYRRLRDRRYYGSAYSNYYDSYNDYITDRRYLNDYYYYDNGYKYDYDKKYDNNYDYNTSYTSANFRYRGVTGYAGTNAYTNKRCAYFDGNCQFHRDRDIDGDYTYVQYAPNTYVRSDYYDEYYASERSRFLDYSSYNNYYYRYY